MDRDQARHAAAGFVLGAHQAARALGRDHDHVDVGRRDDRAEVDAEPVRKRQRHPRPEMLDDVAHVDRRLFLVGDQHHHEIGLMDRLGDRGDGEPVAPRLVAALDEPGRSPTTTCWRESCRLSACARPWLP
jgi:hypothetical protein